jgi:hypothetical protein
MVSWTPQPINAAHFVSIDAQAHACSAMVYDTHNTGNLPGSSGTILSGDGHLVCDRAGLEVNYIYSPVSSCASGRVNGGELPTSVPALMVAPVS